jgi:enoyl-CoA hydratase/carnithine racemase
MSARTIRTAEQFHVEEVSPSYWRVTFDNGPVNLLDPDTINQLGALVSRMENDPDLTVVVFRSGKPGYFMAHWDALADNARVAGMQPGPTGLHPYLDNFIRLIKLPVCTISEIRGRARGASSEFVLATDIRFASELATMGQIEVGVGAVCGGGPMARLGRLVGRGRALEILLGGDDISARLATDYGYVNRLIADAEIAQFTDAFARRIATFDKVAVSGVKKLVDVATLPPDEEFAPGLKAFFATAGLRCWSSPGCSWRRACRSRTVLSSTSAQPSERCGRHAEREEARYEHPISCRSQCLRT